MDTRIQIDYARTEHLPQVICEYVDLPFRNLFAVLIKNADGSISPEENMVYFHNLLNIKKGANHAERPEQLLD